MWESKITPRDKKKVPCLENHYLEDEIILKPSKSCFDAHAIVFWLFPLNYIFSFYLTV